MTTVLSSSTRLACVLGHPVAHSVSPQMHNAAFAAVGVDAVYVAFDVATSQVAAAVAGLGALGALGANVTVPHKRAVFELAQQRAAAAEAVGAANTLWWSEGVLAADNTDLPALQEVLQSDVGLARGDEVLLFGAGGSSRAAAVALGRLGASVTVVARRAGPAQEMADLARAHGAAAASSGADLDAAAAKARIVINSTPLGLGGEPLPGPLMRLRRDQVALDLVYGPADTPFAGAARGRGAAAHDGLGMLVGQAALSFERWTGAPAPVEVMRAAARSALGR